MNIRRNYFSISIVVALLFLFFSVYAGGGTGGSTGGAAPSPPPPKDPGGEGILIQTIYSPLGTVLESSTTTYYAGDTEDTTQTIVKSRYKDFAIHYGTNSLGFNSEPFCKIGGMYRINIYNDPVQKPELNETVDLFYCKTIKDMIKEIKIPASWESANLVLYCNDGQIINMKDINFEFLTSQMSVYKGCVLKNLDLDSENTIIYGLEVGNKKLDDNPGFLFSEEDMISQATSNLEFSYAADKENGTGTNEEYIWIDYQRHILNSQAVVERPYDGKNFICPTSGYTGSCDEVTPIITERYPGFTSFQFVRDDPVIKQVLYKVNVQTDFEYSYYVFNDSKDNEFYFDYDPFSSFYSLRENSDELSVPITNVFFIPSDFDLSRVALFRSFSDGRKVYGYEGAASRKMQTSLSNPIYKIKFDDSFGFSNLNCEEMLAPLEAKRKDLISLADQAVCTSTGNILINSVNLDSGDNQGRALNTFKNTILTLQ